MPARKKWARVAPFVIGGASLANAIYYGARIASGDTGMNGGHIFALVLHLLIVIPAGIYLLIQGARRLRQGAKRTASDTKNLPSTDANSSGTAIGTRKTAE